MDTSTVEIQQLHQKTTCLLFEIWALVDSCDVRRMLLMLVDWIQLSFTWRLDAASLDVVLNRLFLGEILLSQAFRCCYKCRDVAAQCCCSFSPSLCFIFPYSAAASCSQTLKVHLEPRECGLPDRVMSASVCSLSCTIHHAKGLHCGWAAKGRVAGGVDGKSLHSADWTWDKTSYTAQYVCLCVWKGERDRGG